MSRRLLSTLVLPLSLPLVLIGCQKADHDNGAVADAAAKAAAVPCALAGATSFQGICTVERSVSGDGLALVMHHPDGGFRRLLVTTDGRGVVTADGADQATVTVVDPSTIEVAVGRDRYRLPATVKGQDIPKQ